MIITTSSKNKQLLGENNKSLNKRVLASTNLDNSILVIDLYYYSRLIDNKLKYSSSFGQKWASLASAENKILALQAINDVLEPILKLKRLVKVDSVVLIRDLLCNLSSTGLELYKLFTSVVSFSIICPQPDSVNSLYSLAVTNKNKYIILSDNLDFWGICSKKSDIHQALVTKNNNIKLYTDKFGLEYLSSVIQTNKLVNKMRLSKLKYVNLQYLFILLLYTKFKFVRADEDLDLSDKPFLGSKGKALEMLSQSHREISYIFLTKQSLMDIFLTSSATNFILNLSQLLKITLFDVKLMSTFANYYAKHSIKQIPIHKVPPGKPLYKLVEQSKLYCFHDIPVSQKSIKKAVPKPIPELDIANLETSAAVDSILRSLAW